MDAAARVKDEAHRLGFELAGICSSDAPIHHDFYLQWLAQGFHASMDYLVRHTDLKTHPAQLLEGCRSVIAVGLNYNQPNLPEPGMPRIARYALGRDYHKVLRKKLNHLAKSLETDFPGAQFRACVDSAPIFEREFAHQAGLGWFGKNTCLINSHRGSWFFIGLLLTTAELPYDRPALGGCGTCRKCIDACPTGAIIYENERWQVDSRQCISYQTIEQDGPLTVETAGWTFGCDICQEVCPFNEVRPSQPLRGVRTEEPDFLQRRSWPTLVELAQVDQAHWDSLTAGSPTRRTGIKGLQRNARANLEAEKSQKDY